jgi:hypothetical protein
MSVIPGQGPQRPPDEGGIVRPTEVVPVDWLPWLVVGAVLVLYVIPISHELFRRRFGYRCPCCRGRCRFSGRSFGFMDPGCNFFTCPNCRRVFWEVWGRLSSEKPGIKALDD